MVKQNLKPWHQRWAENNIGFHQQNINQHLQDYVKQHQQQLGEHVLVPLCGKSMDMLWLKKQGFKVTGIEISQQAIQSFFTENNLEYEIDLVKQGQCYRAEDIQILEKSFFDVNQEDLLTKVNWVYDRAALIALDESLRKAYASHLKKLIPQAKHMLCICIEKSIGDESGPPFSVMEKEVRHLYQSFWSEMQIKRIEKQDAPDTCVYSFYKS
ncbi:thiopurine S-methyltransferase [bacterium]|nr:thiopurine S-methyltransferase [bacterium]